MVVPYPSTSSGPKDAYNYFHSQVRINIECLWSFGEQVMAPQNATYCKDIDL